jgi:hypothetical protein
MRTPMRRSASDPIMPCFVRGNALVDSRRGV